MLGGRIAGQGWGGGVSLIIEDVGAAASKNVSTEGELDWFALVTSSAQLASETGNRYWKIGGSMYLSWHLFTKGVSAAVATFAAQQSTTSADTPVAFASNLTNNTAGAEVNTVGATTGYGFGFSAPSSGDVTRVLRMNVACSSTTATMTCRLDTGKTVSLQLDSGDNATIERELKVTYRGGSRLHLGWVTNVHHATGTHRIKFQNATLALS